MFYCFYPSSQPSQKVFWRGSPASSATTSAFSAFHIQTSLLRTLNWGFYGTFTLSVCITLSSSSSSPEFRFPSTPASSSTTSVHIPPSLLRTFQQSSPGFAASCFCSYSTFHFMTLSSSIRYPEFRFPSSSASSATTSVHTPPSLLRTSPYDWNRAFYCIYLSNLYSSFSSAKSTPSCTISHIWLICRFSWNFCKTPCSLHLSKPYPRKNAHDMMLTGSPPTDQFIMRCIHIIRHVFDNCSCNAITNLCKRVKCLYFNKALNHGDNSLVCLISRFDSK